MLVLTCKLRINLFSFLITSINYIKVMQWMQLIKVFKVFIRPMRTKNMHAFMQMKNTLQIIIIRLRLVFCIKLMSNYRAKYSQNLSQTELFKFTILVLYDTLYLNIKDLILQSYFNTFTRVKNKQLGELTCEESNVS